MFGDLEIGGMNFCNLFFKNTIFTLMSNPSLVSNLLLLRSSFIKVSPIYFEIVSQSIEKGGELVISEETTLENIQYLLIEKINQLALCKDEKEVFLEILTGTSSHVLTTEKLKVVQNQLPHFREPQEKFIYAFAKAIFIDKEYSFAVSVKGISSQPKVKDTMSYLATLQRNVEMYTENIDKPVQKHVNISSNTSTDTSVLETPTFESSKPVLKCKYYYKILSSCGLFVDAIEKVTKQSELTKMESDDVDVKNALLFVFHFASTMRHGSDNLSDRIMAKKMGGNCVWILFHHEADNPKYGDLPDVRSGLYLFDADNMVKHTIYVPLDKDNIDSLKASNPPSHVSKIISSGVMDLKSRFQEITKRLHM